MKSASSTDRTAYLKAARRVYKGINKWSCCAIAARHDAESPECDLVDRYEAVFRNSGGSFWGTDWDYEIRPSEFMPKTTPQGKQCRLLALCFMAAMVEAGDA